jgi:hypothetical protein
MNHSQSDLDDDSDGDDKSIMFDIPEEIMEPVDDPGFDSDQMEDFGDNDGSFEPDGLLDDSALDESPNEPHSSGGNCGNVPEIIIQLQKQLLKGYTLPPCPTQAQSSTHSLRQRYCHFSTTLHGQSHMALSRHIMLMHRYLQRLHRRRSSAFIKSESWPLSRTCSFIRFSELNVLIIRYDKMVSHMMPHVH